MIYKVQRWADLFINPSYKEDERLFLKAKMMLQAFLLTSFFSLFYLLISYTINFSYGVVFIWMNVVGFLVLPLLLRIKFSLNIVGNLYIMMGSLAVIGIIYHSGGLRSPVLP